MVCRRDMDSDDTIETAVLAGRTVKSYPKSFEVCTGCNMFLLRLPVP